MEYYDIKTLITLTSTLKINFNLPTLLLNKSYTSLPIYQLVFFLKNNYLTADLNISNDLSDNLNNEDGYSSRENFFGEIMACARIVEIDKIYKYFYRVVSMIKKEEDLTREMESLKERDFNSPTVFIEVFRVRMANLTNLFFREKFGEDDLIGCDEDEREIIKKGIKRFKMFM